MIDPRTWKELVEAMHGLRELHEGLAELVQSKLDAMRRADLHALRELAVQEQAIVRRVQEQEARRRGVLDGVAEQLGLPRKGRHSVTVSQLAERLSEPYRSQILEAADGLRSAVLAVSRVNRIAGGAVREVAHHLQWVLASVRPGDTKPFAYAGNGAAVGASETRILEVVG